MRVNANILAISATILIVGMIVSVDATTDQHLDSPTDGLCMVAVTADARLTPGRSHRAIVALYVGQEFRALYTVSTHSEDLDDPFVSADGQRVFFLRYGIGNSLLVVLDLATTQVSEIPLPAEAARWNWLDNPDLSPDGTRIVFEAGTTPEVEIENPTLPYRPKTGLYIMNLDGTGLRQVRSEDTYNAFPNWSPDGREIAFSMSPNGKFGGREPDTDIYIVGVDGMNLRRLTTIHISVAPEWSPDGDELLFIAPRDYAYPDGDSIMVMELATRRTRHLGLGDSPQWTPDGGWISFLGEDGLYVMRPDGTDIRQVTQDYSTNAIDWWQGADVEACIGGE